MTKACQDPDIQRWILDVPTPYTEADARRWLERSEQGWRERTRAPFVVAAADDGEPLGAIEVELLDREIGQVGYWVKPSARGRGVAAAALRLVAGWAFSEAGVGRLQLTTHPANLASQRVADRAGFTREGTLRGWLLTPEGRRDSVMFSLLPRDLH